MLRNVTLAVVVLACSACQTTLTVPPANVTTAIIAVDPANHQHTYGNLAYAGRFKGLSAAQSASFITTPPGGLPGSPAKAGAAPKPHPKSPEGRIVSACKFNSEGSSEQKVFQFAPILATFIAAAVVEVIDKKIEKEIRERTTTYASRQIFQPFLKDGALSTVPGCLIFERTNNKGGAKEPGLQLILQTAVVGDTLRVRPLRLVFRDAAVKDSGGVSEWGIGVNGTIKSFSRAETVTGKGPVGHGRMQVLYEGALASKKVSNKKLGHAHYFFKPDAFKVIGEDSGAILLPLPAYGHSNSDSTVAVDLRVGEIGKNMTLETLQKVFGKVKGPLESQLKTAINGLLAPN